MERIPKNGELYRHFKDKLYQIVTVAIHSETGEKLVIYQALYGDYRVYARPLSMFVSECELVNTNELSTGEEKVPEADNEKEIQCENIDNSASGSDAEKKIMAFFDAENMEEKYNILASMRDIIDDHMINNMAVVMDVVIPEAPVTERYEALKSCIRVKQRYEKERL